MIKTLISLHGELNLVLTREIYFPATEDCAAFTKQIWMDLEDGYRFVTILVGSDD